MRPQPQIPGYRLLRVLGRGGMGTIYHALHEATGNMAAIKAFDPQVGSLGNELLRRFRHEMKALIRMSHPNIVSILAAEEIDGVPYLIMEYVDGLNLEELLETRGALPIGLACAYMRQAALGLQHIHEQGLVHRDLKPANMMVTATAAGHVPAGTVKLLDLGLARVFSVPGQSSLSRITEEGFVVGTPDYIAPEQVADSHVVDIRADIYSLGCTFYHALSGQVPFPVADLLEKLDCHRWNPGRPLERLRPEIPTALADLVRKMMAKSAQQRQQTPAELVAALDGFLASLPPEAAALPAAADEELELRVALHDALRRQSRAEARELATRLLARNARDTLAVAVQSLFAEETGNHSTMHESACFEAHTDPVLALASLPAGQGFVSAGGDRLVHVWDLRRKLRVRSLRGHSEAVRAVAVSPDGQRVVSAGADGRLILWDCASGKHLRTLRQATQPMNAVTYSAADNLLLSAGQDGIIEVSDPETGARQRQLRGHQAPIVALTCASAGSLLLSSSLDGSLRLWDATRGQQLRALTPGVACPRVALAPAGDFALGAGSDDLLHVWNFETDEEVKLPGHAARLTCVALSSAGRFAVSGAEDGSLLLWDLESGDILSRLEGHSAPISSVAFADDHHALAGSAEGSVRYWRLPLS